MRIPAATARHKNDGWGYLGNEKTYQIHVQNMYFLKVMAKTIFILWRGYLRDMVLLLSLTCNFNCCSSVTTVSRSFICRPTL